MNNATICRLGDRVKVFNSEFPTWIPTEATVVKLYLKFPNAGPDIQRRMIEVLLDEHPFPEVLAPEPMRNLAFDMENPYLSVEFIE